MECSSTNLLGSFIMYHVTSRDSSEEQPRWTEIELHVANDKTYDGDLVGLPVASFTTTQYNYDLPTISPYPRDGIRGNSYWRVKVPFEYDKYNIFRMNNHSSQVHLLCLAKDGTDVEKILSAALRRKLLTDGDAAKYFPNGKPNQYGDEKIFVNVSFIRPVKIPKGGQSWDKVKKSGHTYGELKSIDDSDTLKEWGMKQMQLSWENAILSLRDIKPDDHDAMETS